MKLPSDPAREASSMKSVVGKWRSSSCAATRKAPASAAQGPKLALCAVTIIFLALSVGCEKSREKIDAENAAKAAAANARQESEAQARTRAALEVARTRLLEAFKNKLKDPDSAKIKNVEVKEFTQGSARGIAICGQVNAKNAMGGYTGFQVFVV